MRKSYIILILLLLVTSLTTKAHVSVTVEMDSNNILIGQQVHIALKVTTESNQHIVFPVFPQKQLIPGVEVVSEKLNDSQRLNDGKQIQVTKVYTITSFDTSFYYIPPFKVQVAGKSYSSNSLALKVGTIPVDTLHLDKFYGPKDIADVPFSWHDWTGLFGYSILLVILLCLTGYILLQLHNKRPLLKKFRIRPPLPPHQWAIREIDKINHQKDVQEDTKQYYTRLTDILRSYIQQRYNFNAREMTSAEIIEHLTKQQDASTIAELQQLFETADLAKFAKLRTQLNENDENLLRAVEFIKATKVENSEQIKPKEVIPVEVQRTTRTRLILKLIIGALSALCLALLFLIGRGFYYLFF
jgi:hypothetical protein